MLQLAEGVQDQYIHVPLLKLFAMAAINNGISIQFHSYFYHTWNLLKATLITHKKILDIMKH